MPMNSIPLFLLLLAEYRRFRFWLIIASYAIATFTMVPLAHAQTWSNRDIGSVGVR